MTSEKVFKIRSLIVSLLAIFNIFLWWNPAESVSQGKSNYLEVSFLDVGQGDSIFMETSDNIQVLIDGGPDAQVLRELGKLMDVSDRYIDIVVATHPDIDHIGGLIDVLERYDIGLILLTENVSDTTASKKFLELAHTEEAEIVYARRDQLFDLGSSTSVRVLFPNTNPSEMESNQSSIVLQVKHDQIKFMLTGDSPKSIEEYLAGIEGEALESDVLKIGHHGSKTSTAKVFLENVGPKYAVVSAEKDSRYGHPHKEVTDLLTKYEIETLSTADLGTINFYRDGVKVWIK
jgi:competence protein ComEC